MEECYRLHYACELGDCSQVEELLDRGIAVDISDDYSTTPLQVAAANGHGDVVRLLLMRGATLDAGNALGWTAILHACRYGHHAVVLSLLQNQADINSRTCLGVSALMLASRGGHLALCKSLVDAGHVAAAGPLEVRGVDGVATCEFNSVMGVHKEILRLQIAAHFGHDSTVRYLLNRGYDVNSRTASTGINALMLTALNGHMTTAQVLIERGADADLTNVNRVTALDLGDLHREVKGYLQRKTTVSKSTQNIPEPKKARPDIFDAVKESDLTTLTHILQCDPSQCNALHEGASPLIYAAIAGNQPACELLLTNGRSDIDKQDQSSGWTALMQSIYYGHSAVTRYLLSEGADVLLESSNGCTAFQMASLIDDIDTDLYRVMAAKATETKGEDNKNRKDGSGLKFWWKRTSNRFRALKIGRTLNFTSTRVPTNSETEPSTMKPEMQSTIPMTSDGKSSQVTTVTGEIATDIATSVDTASKTTETERPKQDLMTTSLDSILRTNAMNVLEKEKQPFHQPKTKSLHEMPPVTIRKNCSGLGSTSTLISPRPIVAPVKLLQSYSSMTTLNNNYNNNNNNSNSNNNNNNNSSNGGGVNLNNSMISSQLGGAYSSQLGGAYSSQLGGAYYTSNNLNTGYYGSHHGGSSSSPSSSSGASGLSGVFSRSRSSATSSTLTAGVGIGSSDVRNDQLDNVLKNLALEKFKPLFEEQEVDMEAFLSLTENDLTEIGIFQQTSRTRILSAIEQLTTGKVNG